MHGRISNRKIDLEHGSGFEPVNQLRPDCRRSALRPEPKATLQRFERLILKKKKVAAKTKVERA